MTVASAQAAVAFLLALAAGGVDAVSYIVLDRVFTANMTGNSTTLGIAAGMGDGATLLPLAVAVAVFVATIAAVTGGIELATRRGSRSVAAAVLLGEAVLVAVFMGVFPRLAGHSAGLAPGGGRFYALLTLAVVAMGAQTATFTRALGDTVRTTYVSGMLTMFGQDLVNLIAGKARQGPSYLHDVLGLGGRRDSLARLGLHLAVWASFVAGAVEAGYAERRWTEWALAPAVVALLAAAAIDRFLPVQRPRRGSWSARR